MYSVMKDWTEERRGSGIEVHSTENNTNDTVCMFVMVNKSAVIVPTEVESDIFNTKSISEAFFVWSCSNCATG